MMTTQPLKSSENETSHATVPSNHMLQGPSTAAGSYSSSWGCQMEALVSDLNLALDESQKPQRRRRAHRRRGNQPYSPQGGVKSDCSSSSVEEAVQTAGNYSQEKSSQPHTDTDDEDPSTCSRYRAPIAHRGPRSSSGMVVESDSVNEGFSPVQRPSNLRRKPRYKRLAFEADTMRCRNGSPSCRRWRPTPVIHRVNMVHTPRMRRATLQVGKRKRSREGVPETEDLTNTILSNGGTKSLTPPTRGKDDYASSEDSDGGRGVSFAGGEVFTCDEGREADDEQSDWVGEGGVGPVYGVPTYSGVSTYSQYEDECSLSNSHNMRLRFQKIRERFMRREIRAGRRRLRDKRQNSAHNSVSESVTKFLLDPMASELQVRPASSEECDQLQRLVQLYSLNLRVGEEETKPAMGGDNIINNCFVTKMNSDEVVVPSISSNATSCFSWPQPPTEVTKKRRTNTPAGVTSQSFTNNSTPNRTTDVDMDLCVTGPAVTEDTEMME